MRNTAERKQQRMAWAERMANVGETVHAIAEKEEGHHGLGWQATLSMYIKAGNRGQPATVRGETLLGTAHLAAAALAVSGLKLPFTVGSVSHSGGGILEVHVRIECDTETVAGDMVADVLTPIANAINGEKIARGLGLAHVLTHLQDWTG